MTVAKPLTYWDRIARYIHQNGSPRLTAPQRRRLQHKQNRADGPAPAPWAWIEPAEQQLAGAR